LVAAPPKAAQDWAADNATCIPPFAELGSASAAVEASRRPKRKTQGSPSRYR
jgi:hypothetical protein